MTTTHPFPTLKTADLDYVIGRIDAEIYALETTKRIASSTLSELHIVVTTTPDTEWVSSPLRIQETIRVRSFVERVWHLVTTAVWLNPTDVSRSVFKEKPHVVQNAVVDQTDAPEDIQKRLYRLATLRQSLTDRKAAGQTVLLFFKEDIITAQNDIKTWLSMSSGSTVPVDRMTLSDYVDTLDLRDTHINNTKTPL